MCETILDKAHRYPWATVSLLLFINYEFWCLMLYTYDVEPMDINNISYGGILFKYQSYLGVIGLVQLAIFFYQIGILTDGKEMSQWIKYFYHFYLILNLAMEFLFIGEFVGELVAFKTATTDDVETNFAHNFSMMEYHSNNLNFISVENAGNLTTGEHPGIISGYSYRQLIEKKKYIDEFQKKYQCCGHDHPSDWSLKYSGKIMSEQRNAASAYIWWMNDGDSKHVPNSCCVKGTGSNCVIARDGCLPTLLKEAKMNVTFISVIVVILAIVGIARDIAVVKMIRTVELKPFPRIPFDAEDERVEAGSDLTKLSNIISVRIGQSTESSA